MSLSAKNIAAHDDFDTLNVCITQSRARRITPEKECDADPAKKAKKAKKEKLILILIFAQNGGMELSLILLHQLYELITRLIRRW